MVMMLLRTLVMSRRLRLLILIRLVLSRSVRLLRLMIWLRLRCRRIRLGTFRFPMIGMRVSLLSLVTRLLLILRVRRMVRCLRVVLLRTTCRRRVWVCLLLVLRISRLVLRGVIWRMLLRVPLTIMVFFTRRVRRLLLKLSLRWLRCFVWLRLMMCRLSVLALTIRMCRRCRLVSGRRWNIRMLFVFRRSGCRRIGRMRRLVPIRCFSRLRLRLGRLCISRGMRSILRSMVIIMV